MLCPLQPQWAALPGALVAGTVRRSCEGPVSWAAPYWRGWLLKQAPQSKSGVCLALATSMKQIVPVPVSGGSTLPGSLHQRWVLLPSTPPVTGPQSGLARPASSSWTKAWLLSRRFLHLTGHFPSAVPPLLPSPLAAPTGLPQALNHKLGPTEAGLPAPLLHLNPSDRTTAASGPTRHLAPALTSAPTAMRSTTLHCHHACLYTCAVFTAQIFCLWITTPTTTPCILR